jgi:alpha-beta hydrolase superfamily lysophospholipase
MPLSDEGGSREDYAALFPDAKLRLLAAIDFAKLKKAEKIFIIGDGLGGVIASYSLADKNKSVDGLVIIRLPLITPDEQIGQPSGAT